MYLCWNFQLNEAIAFHSNTQSFLEYFRLSPYHFDYVNRSLLLPPLSEFPCMIAFMESKHLSLGLSICVRCVCVCLFPFILEISGMWAFLRQEMPSETECGRNFALPKQISIISQFSVVIYALWAVRLLSNAHTSHTHTHIELVYVTYKLFVGFWVACGRFFLLEMNVQNNFWTFLILLNIRKMLQNAECCTENMLSWVTFCGESSPFSYCGRHANENRISNTKMNSIYLMHDMRNSNDSQAKFNGFSEWILTLNQWGLPWHQAQEQITVILMLNWLLVSKRRIWSTANR